MASARQYPSAKTSHVLQALGPLVRKWPWLRPAKPSQLVRTLTPPVTAVSQSPAQREVQAAYEYVGIDQQVGWGAFEGKGPPKAREIDR